MVLSIGFLEFYFYHISIPSKYWGKLYHSNEISNIGLKSWFNPLKLYFEMEHGLSASSHLLSLLPPIKFWYIWSDISGIMGSWLGKRKSNPVFFLLSAALALTHFLSLLLPPLSRAPHTMQSVTRANLYLYLRLYIQQVYITYGLIKRMPC